jgi:hypothetical protein
MAISASDIKIYLTGIAADGVNSDGGVSQDNSNLSLGGFRSSTEVNQSTTLSGDIGATDTTITVDDIGSLPGASSLNPAYAVIGSELIKYTARSTSLGSGNLIGVTRGVLGRVASAHSEDDVVTGVTSQNLFDHVRATENLSGDTEYRCFSVRNTNSTDTAFNVKVYLSPAEYDGTTTSATNDTGSGATLIDASLIGQFADDFFNLGSLEITGGAGISGTASENFYNITDFDFATGTITIDGDWNNGLPNTTTTYVATSKNASPNPNDAVSFAVERHVYSDLGAGMVATDGGTTFLVDSTLPGAGWTSSINFVGAYMLLLTGDGVDGIPKAIESYDETLGKITITGSFVNTGVTAGDLYAIVRGPTEVQVPSEGTAPPAGTGFISSFSTASNIDEAVSIDVANTGEDLIHDEVFFVWMKRVITANTNSYSNDNVIPNISFEI